MQSHLTARQIKWGRITLYCEECGKRFERYPSQVVQSGNAFCSRTCSGLHQRNSPERFWERVEKGDGCWEWQGPQFGHDAGYGRFKVNGATHLAHRYSFTLAYGPIPDDLWVLHTCDNPACVRNDDEGVYEVNGVLLPRRGHLALGTPADNSADMVEKGRSASGEHQSLYLHPELVRRGDGHWRRKHPELNPMGEANGRALLTDDQVREIRRTIAAKESSQAALALAYGVSPGTISHIVTRRAWAHLT